MLAAREPWNRHDYDTAFRLFKAAAEEGVEGPWLSTAHCMLGQIFLMREDLPAAVDQFLKCLAVPDRDASDAWQVAKRLHYIYSEAGRSKEAAALEELAQVANKQGPGWALTPDVEIELRRLTRKCL